MLFTKQYILGTGLKGRDALSKKRLSENVQAFPDKSLLFSFFDAYAGFDTLVEGMFYFFYFRYIISQVDQLL